MSLSKYMEAYKNMGFFTGSIIRVTITDTSYYGQELILSNDSDVIATRTIISDTTDIFTNESGTLTVQTENSEGTILSATVEVSAYATYNVTLSGSSSDSERQIYVDTDSITISDTVSSGTVKVAYTGDISTVSATPDKAIVDVSVDDGVITVTDNGSDTQGSTTVTATVESSTSYDSAEISFTVNKTNGTYGTWSDASDDVISNMMELADAGEIDLADYWSVGESRTVTLSAMEAGTVTPEQPEQEIELVILHNPIDDDKYRLTTPTTGLRYQPHFIIGVKDCLERTSAMGYFSKTVTAKYSSSSTKSTTGYVVGDTSSEAELLTVLNDTFITALPSYIQSMLKYTNRRYCCGLTENSRIYNYGYMTYTSMSTKSHKVSIANIQELGFTQALSGTGVTYGSYINSGSIGSSDTSYPSYVASVLNSCGTAFDYYADTDNLIKGKGVDGSAIAYLTSDALVSAYCYSSSTYQHSLAEATYMDDTGAVQTNDLSSESQRLAQRGVSPILFI